jgi:hypothetical protein
MSGKKKISVLAAEVGIDPREAVKKCKEMGFVCVTKASNIQPEEAEQFLREFKNVDQERDSSEGASLFESSRPSVQPAKGHVIPHDSDPCIETEDARKVELVGSYVVMDCRDLREVLTIGYLAPLDFYRNIELKSKFIKSNCWQVVNEHIALDTGGGIPTVEISKTCLVRVNDSEIIDGTLSKLIPACEINEIVFLDVKHQKDFVARNSALRGFPTQQLSYVVEPCLDFIEVECSNEKIDEDMARVECDILSESNRVHGAIGALLNHGNLTDAQLDFIAKTPVFDKKNLGLIISEIGVRFSNEENWHRRIETILDTLSRDEWKDGFASPDLLRSIIDSFETWDPKYVMPLKKDIVFEMLESMVEVHQEMLKDDRNQLLRGLFLMLKSSSGNLIENLLDRQLQDELDRPADTLINLALLLSGWYKGFSSIPTLKEDSSFGIYRFCSRGLVNAVERESHIPNLFIERKYPDHFTRITELLDFEFHLACSVATADSGLMEAWYALQQVADCLDAKIDFNMDHSDIQIEIDQVLLLGSKCKDGIIRWHSTWTLKDKKAKRKWSAQQRSLINEIAKEASCSVYVLENEFPSCGLHVEQLLGTMDHSEIIFHLESIVATYRELSNKLELQ